ncbi:30S ribosomal protein S1 [Buchnera aphidicola (Tetraneura ulmi)]|uniref:30S ribosomal protein S1 n=1 Tax=Buchnera aphidicola TaxID=9 RepID=UPI003464A10E
MKESFHQLFEESLQKIKTQPGSIINGIVVSIDKETVVVDAGLKSESSIPIEQFKNNKGKTDVKIGDLVEVALDAIEDGFGETILSREKAKRHAAWIKLENSFFNSSTVVGVINGKVKGGFTVELNDIRAFLPGSLVDVRPIRDTIHLEGKELDFKVIKLDKKRNNVVVSRRAVIELENSVERSALLESLKEGINIKGIVKNLTDYGAFIDLGGVDGLLHITDMAWKRVKHPSEIVSVGEEIVVQILKFDREKTRVSLGLKQLGLDPWIEISKKYPEGSKITGRVTNLTEYGCFVEIQEGVEGLVHVSEMDWTNKNVHPSKVVQVNKKVDVMILDIDEERRRISLGIKQCLENPWKLFEKSYKKGDKVNGKIKSITDFGIFIGLDGNIDGLVHLSDISWNSTGEEAVKKYKKGDSIVAVVLQVDSERERISLGIKQIKEDIFNRYLKNKKIGSMISLEIISVEKETILTKINEELIGKINLKNILIQIKKINELKVNDIIKLKIISINRKKRILNILILNKLYPINMENIISLNKEDNNQKLEKQQMLSTTLELLKFSNKDKNL